MAILYSPAPAFAHISESVVWERLRDQVPDDAIIFSNLLIHDAEGEHELDFVVILPNQGIVVIEVKGGYISPLGDGKFIQKSRNEEREIDPVGQVNRNRHALDRWLISHSGMRFNVKTSTLLIFATTHLNSGYSHSSIPKEKLIDSDGLLTLSSALTRSLNVEKGGRSVPTSDQVELIVDCLRSQVFDNTDINDIRFLTDERSLHTMELVAENMRYLDFVAKLDRFYLKGPAGSGKTAMATELARRLTVNGQKVLLLTYNRALALWLQRNRESLNKCERVKMIRNVHSFMEEWGVEFPDPDSDEFFAVGCAEEFKILAPQKSHDEKFDAIIIDEAQDFSDLWLEAVQQALVDPQHGAFYLFGDDRQQLVNRRGKFGQTFPELILNSNIRNSKQIGELANLFTDEPTSAIGFSGPDVLYVEVPEDYTTFDATSDVINFLLDNDWNHNQIAVLTVKHRHPMHKEGVDFHGDKYFRNLWKADDVFASTVSSFKGLDRPAVILGIDGFHDDMDAIDVMYSGITRARDLLIIVSRRSELAANFSPEQVAALTANPIDVEFNI